MNKKDIDKDVEVVKVVEDDFVIKPLSIDYPNEWLNDMARKVNEIVDYLKRM